jgi:flagellar biosynthesis chaperone FliJ
VLKLSGEEESDYQTAINSAYEQTRNLFDKLKMLHNNIRRYHRQLADHTDMNQILTEHFYEFKENLADKIYYPIKTFDSVHRFKTPILTLLKDWLYSDQIMESLGEEVWIRERKKRSLTKKSIKEESVEDAKKKIVKIIDVYENMDQLLKEIDKKNTEYTKATLDRMDFLLNTDRSVIGKVRELIKVLSADTTGHWNRKITDAMDISTQVIVDEASLYTSRNVRIKRDTKREKERNVIDKDQILSETTAFKHSVQEAFSKKRVQQYMLDLLDVAEKIEAKDIPVGNDSEYVKMLLGVLDSDDKKSAYDVVFKEGVY